MTQANHFQMTGRVSECECDLRRRLTPGGMLRMIQDISTQHSDALGAPEEVLRQHHAAFLLAKISLLVQTPIPAGVTLTLDTYPAQVRAAFHRYTTLRLPDGTLAAGADARWVLVDTDTMRILRRVPPELPIHYEHLKAAAQLDLGFPKPDAPADLGEERAGYSRCDQNRHLNNTRYADLVCDRLPLSRLEDDFVRRMVLLYHREVPLGECFALLGGQADPDGYYFAGRREGCDCFEAYVSFAPQEVPQPDL